MEENTGLPGVARIIRRAIAQSILIINPEMSQDQESRTDLTEEKHTRSSQTYIEGRLLFGTLSCRTFVIIIIARPYLRP